MNIALVLQHKLLLGIQRFLQSGTRQALPAPVHMCSPVRPSALHAPRQAAARSSLGGTGARHFAPKAMPLRVLRVVESGMPRSSAGRLVISGRMADVCAELDRLVEREAALQALH